MRLRTAIGCGLRNALAAGVHSNVPDNRTAGFPAVSPQIMGNAENGIRCACQLRRAVWFIAARILKDIAWLERARLFRQNLEEFLVWTRDIGLDPTRVLGSYAGAIGMPQFMTSNILQYARSDEPNRPPELTGAADSILSIAHYLRRYGWEAGRPVVWNIGVDSGSQRIAQATADGRPEPHHTLGQLLQAGLLLNKAFLDLRAELDTPVTVVDLPTPGQPVEY